MRWTPSKSKESSGFALFASGVAKCLAGLMIVLQIKTADSTDMSEKAQLDETGIRVWTLMMDFVMQILVIGLAFSFGYLVGTMRNGAKAVAHRNPAPTASSTLRVESEGTQTSGFVTVQASELTLESLKERLRRVEALVSGPKEDLVNRYLRHLDERHLVLTRPP